MDKKVKYIISILFSSILLIFLYTLLHEGGHALVAISYGGKVNKLTLGLNAHVQTAGTNFTTFSEALFNSAGALLPVIFLIIALVIYKPKINNIFYHIFYGLLSLNIIGSLLAWVTVPLIALFTLPPAGDDITKFLNITGLHPLFVSLIALLIISTLIFIIYKKGLFGKTKEIYCILFQESRNKVSKVFLIRLLIGIALGAGIAVVSFSMLRPKPVLETSFSMEVSPTTEDMKLPFKVGKSKLYSMDLELTAKGHITDIQIYTENGTLVYQNICEWFTLGTSLDLEKGNYILVLTFLKDDISMQEHFKAKGYKFEAGVVEKLKDMYKNNNSVENYPISFSATIK